MKNGHTRMLSSRCRAFSRERSVAGGDPVYQQTAVCFVAAFLMKLLAIRLRC